MGLLFSGGRMLEGSCESEILGALPNCASVFAQSPVRRRNAESTSSDSIVFRSPSERNARRDMQFVHCLETSNTAFIQHV